MNSKSPLYQSIVVVGKEYLGPAGERFMRRQIEMHLRIKPDEIQYKDIPVLAEWSVLAFAMLTDDQEYVEAFAYDLNALASAESKKNVRR